MQVNLNAYWLLLKDLGPEEKLTLIEWLTQSVKTAATSPQKQKKKAKPSENDEWVYRFNGSWNAFPETAEELIAMTEGARTMGRQIEAL